MEQITGHQWYEPVEDGGKMSREIHLGDMVYYHRFHPDQKWIVSPAMVVTIGPEKNVGMWVFSHPLPFEASPAFWRPSVPYKPDGHPAPADGSHYWSFRDDR